MCYPRARVKRVRRTWMLLWANLDVAAVGREGEALGGMVVAERLRLRERADAEERRDVGRRAAGLAVIRNVPPGSEPDELRIVRRADKCRRSRRRVRPPSGT
jgi:hypothetical protein